MNGCSDAAKWDGHPHPKHSLLGECMAGNGPHQPHAATQSNPNPTTSIHSNSPCCIVQTYAAAAHLKGFRLTPLLELSTEGLLIAFIYPSL